MGLATLEDETGELAEHKGAEPWEDTVSEQRGPGLSAGTESEGALTSDFPASRRARSKCLW